MKTQKAFTLIELLVVIAVIALLLAIVMPALNKAKVIAAAVVCMANNSSASKAWVSYAQDYKGHLMDGDQSEQVDGKMTFTLAAGGQATVWCFVAVPHNFAGAIQKESVEDEIRGLERGALGTYMGTAWKAYNCPGDKRSIKAPTADPTTVKYNAKFGGYRTFSMGAVYSKRALQSGVGSGEQNYVVTQMSEIVTPSSKFVFMEEFDPRGINHRTWNLNMNNLNSPYWVDALAMVHNGASTFGYADGHGERHKWTGPVTRKFFNPENQSNWVLNSAVLTDRKDLDDFNWFVQGYIPGRK